MKKISMFLAAMGLIAVIVTACGGSSSTDETTENATSSAQATNENSPSATAGATITIANMAFGEPLTVAPGAEIDVVNNDSVEHSVTSDTAGAFDVRRRRQARRGRSPRRANPANIRSTACITRT